MPLVRDGQAGFRNILRMVHGYLLFGYFPPVFYFSMFFHFRSSLSARSGFQSGMLLFWLACLAVIHGFSVPPPVSSGIDTLQLTLEVANTWEMVRKNYVGDCQEERIYRKSIEGMLATLDPHCSFFSPSTYNSFINHRQTSTCGIGATFISARGRIFFRAASPGSPAGRSGLRYGDELLAVNGKDVTGWQVSDVIDQLSGECGDMVSMKISRPGLASPLTFHLKRVKQTVSSVGQVFMVTPETGYLSFRTGFSDGDVQDVMQAVHRLKSMGAQSIVFDLRDNPGGLVHVARDIAAFFLPSGLPVVTLRSRRSNGEVSETVLVSRTPLPETLPLVVLTNQRSASAAEIVAGALQDHDRAWIIGEPTFGKGLVQTVYSLPGGYGLLLTSARYYTPSGRLLQRPYRGGQYYAYRKDQGSQPSAGTDQPTGISGPYFTDRKRVVFGGRGITPDVKVTAPQVRPVHRTLRSLSFLFTRQLIAGLIPGFGRYRLPAITGPHHGVTTGKDLITDALMERFRWFARSVVASEHLPDSVLYEQEEFIRQQLQSELVTAAGGAEKGEQVLLLNDPVVMRAIVEIPQAQRLVRELPGMEVPRP